MDSLIDLKHALADAEESLNHAARLAYELSGERGGREPSKWIEQWPCPECNGRGTCSVVIDDITREVSNSECSACYGYGYYDTHESDPGEPAEPGDPILVALADRLERLIAAFREAVGNEVREAIAAAEREAMEDDREVIREPR